MSPGQGTVPIARPQAPTGALQPITTCIAPSLPPLSLPLWPSRKDRQRKALKRRRRAHLLWFPSPPSLAQLRQVNFPEAPPVPNQIRAVGRGGGGPWCCRDKLTAPSVPTCPQSTEHPLLAVPPRGCHPVSPKSVPARVTAPPALLLHMPPRGLWPSLGWVQLGTARKRMLGGDED